MDDSSGRSYFTSSDGISDISTGQNLRNLLRSFRGTISLQILTSELGTQVLSDLSVPKTPRELLFLSVAA